MLFAKQAFKTNITVFTLFDKPTSNCLQVIAVTLHMAEKLNMSFSIYLMRFDGICVCLKERLSQVLR